MDVLGVLRRRAFDGLSAGVGQSHHQAAAVLRALLAGDEAALLHPGDVVRQAAAVPADLGAELTRPEHAAGRLRQRMEHRVVGARQAASRDELLFQRGVQVLVQVEVRLPHVLLAVVEPSRLSPPSEP